MPQTDRTKRPKCRWCGRTIVKGMVGWRHKHTGRVGCTRQPKGLASWPRAAAFGQVQTRVATPPEGFEVAST